MVSLNNLDHSPEENGNCSGRQSGRQRFRDLARFLQGLLLSSTIAALPAPGYAQGAGTAAAAPARPPTISLTDALARAQKLSPALATALANARIAAEATVQARSLNLPNVVGNAQFAYTEGNGTPVARFIANNGVHEYIAQADVHQNVSLPLLLDYRRNALLAAVARDQARIAQRGLVVAVVQSYAALVAANGKRGALEEALDAAQRFLDTTTQLEQGGEVARADVIKARIQKNDSKVALDAARLVQEQARLALALLIFPDINQPFQVDEDPAAILKLPAFAEAAARARQDNPDIGAALNFEQAARKDTTIAWAGFLPSLTFDYIYGIDANQFATRTSPAEGAPFQNLGYSALAGLSIPVFTWGATYSRVKQARAREKEAAVQLGYAKRAIEVGLRQFYREAQNAEQEIATRKTSISDADESRKLIMLQYKAGEATALEVVNSETTLSTEKTAYYDAETRFATALANLATVTGSLR